ncbi:hypothetical protein ACQR1I_27425 [Bradyrhizobium sp. HKCCYLS2038]|uniref:hypothetical protein n=1 Tax=unclassified Bradyrhizobium TaxID=2631580 RepID=UPI003EB7C5C2
MIDFVVLKNIALFNDELVTEKNPTKRDTIAKLLALEIEKLPDSIERDLARRKLSADRGSSGRE